MSGESVLIVDDSLTVRMDLAEALQEAGLPSALCASLGQARAALHEQTWAAIILDVLLPDGDGVELLAEIRATPRHQDTPVLMLSAEAEVADRIRGLRQGADDYLGKPYNISYLVARVRQALQPGQPDPPHTSTVLVIDADVTSRALLGGALERDGYTVATAGNGEDGLRLAGTQAPAAVVVDESLPGISGTTTIRRIRLDSALRHLPCMLVIADAEQAAQLRAYDAGADAFVSRGEANEVILAKLAALLRQRLQPPAAVQTSSLSAPKRVLAVDDSATYLHGLDAALRGEGYDVVLAQSGTDALDLVAMQRVDCILLDLIMPDLGGRETCRRIKSVPGIRDIPVIMLTALDDQDAMIEGLACGADDYVSKSSEFEIVHARVRAQIRRRQFEDENRHIREELLRREHEATAARAAQQVAEARAALADELKRANEELEAFSYSVSHDLRAPLRSIGGFSRIVLDSYRDSLDEKGQRYLEMVCASVQQMNQLIEGLLQLSRTGRSELRVQPVDLSALARAVATELQDQQPDRRVSVAIDDGLVANGDPRLLRALLDNLIGNAWKFTGRAAEPHIAIGREDDAGDTRFYVRDNGAGFDQQYADRLFQPFSRLHSNQEFPGTGIGLATVRRIVHRHGGRIWACGVPEQGATVYFSLHEAPVGTPGLRADESPGTP
jgi:two-component system NtrC family sensor kinase